METVDVGVRAIVTGVFDRIVPTQLAPAVAEGDCFRGIEDLTNNEVIRHISGGIQVAISTSMCDKKPRRSLEP